MGFSVYSFVAIPLTGGGARRVYKLTNPLYAWYTGVILYIAKSNDALCGKPTSCLRGVYFGNEEI